MRKTLQSEHGKIIARKLVEIRQRAGLSQRQLAEKLGREHSFIANYELGQRRVDLAEFYWICLACETSPTNEALDLMKMLSLLDK